MESTILLHVNCRLSQHRWFARCILSKFLIQLLQLLVSHYLFCHIMAKLIHHPHLKQSLSMDFSSSNTIPNDAVNDISSEFIHSDHFLRTEHILYILLFANMNLCGSLVLAFCAIVHNNSSSLYFWTFFKHFFLFVCEQAWLILS